MQLWWMVAVSMVMALSATAAPDELPIKDGDGKTLAVVAQCNNCQSQDGVSQKKCHTGAEVGWLSGQPCGKCMMAENAGTRFAYPYDLHIIGKLTDDAGQPVKDRFVKLFMANGWSVRTKTSPEGLFRLMLGATTDRISKTPVVLDLGTRVDSPKDNQAHYALYLLPDSYKPCSQTAAKAAPAKEKGKGKKP